MSDPFAVPPALAPPPERRFRGARGEKHPGAKITWAIARAIRAAHDAGDPEVEIVRRFAVNRGTVFKILRNQQWIEPQRGFPP